MDECCVNLVETVSNIVKEGQQKCEPSETNEVSNENNFCGKLCVFWFWSRLTTDQW